MNQVNFNTLDLNLLRIFDALGRERSVTRAGERLGVSQSAISHALNRLRTILDDELFVRGPGGVRPTRRARDIAPQLSLALSQLQRALSSAEFVPAEAEQRFTIICSSYVSLILLPTVVERLRAEAPNVELFTRVPSRFDSRPLFEETAVWVLRDGHPAAAAPLTLERLAELPHVVLGTAGDSAQVVDGLIVEGGLERRIMRDDDSAFTGALAARGLRRIIGLTLPDAQSGLAVVARTDMAALTPRRVATVLAPRYGLRCFEPPYPSAPMRVSVLWSRAHGEQPPIAWLRDLICAVAADV
jgi:DNA-binding transcriptional LysR family regulator